MALEVVHLHAARHKLGRERVGGESVARPGQVEEHHRGHGVGGRDLREGVGGRAAKQPSEVLKRRRFDQRGEKSPRGLLHAPRSDQAGALQMLGNDGVRALVVRARLVRGLGQVAVADAGGQEGVRRVRREVGAQRHRQVAQAPRVGACVVRARDGPPRRCGRRGYASPPQPHARGGEPVLLLVRGEGGVRRLQRERVGGGRRGGGALQPGLVGPNGGLVEAALRGL
mmetsp:Transcript_38780/g.72776  ORF Transcript_38780/g.72776 Transcript_38780/m.72776 type:complete len:227 (+) Transcript_38780:1490-2170(+)